MVFLQSSPRGKGALSLPQLSFGSKPTDTHFCHRRGHPCQNRGGYREAVVPSPRGWVPATSAASLIPRSVPPPVGRRPLAHLARCCCSSPAWPGKWRGMIAPDFFPPGEKGWGLLARENWVAGWTGVRDCWGAPAYLVLATIPLHHGPQIEVRVAVIVLIHAHGPSDPWRSKSGHTFGSGPKEQLGPAVLSPL